MQQDNAESGSQAGEALACLGWCEKTARVGQQRRWVVISREEVKFEMAQQRRVLASRLLQRPRVGGRVAGFGWWV